MTDTDSTILVMGPPGAGKSKFIELLAGPIKLQPNGVSTDILRTISVSPYFTEGKTIKLVKFPGFTDKSDTNLSDAELFIGIATFLDSCVRRTEQIRSIIYLHPIAVDRSNDPDVNRNATMLQRIAQGPGAIQNIVVVTDDDIEEPNLPESLTGLGLERPLRHDGTKLSALAILANAMKKTPIILDLKNEIPRYTDPGRELTRHIRQVMKAVQDQDNELGEMIEDVQNRNSVTQLEADRRQLKVALSHLGGERERLGAPIVWEQVTQDNEVLERVIKEHRDSATKDWKAEYDELVKKNGAKVAEYNELVKKNGAKVAEYDALVNKNNAKVVEYDELLRILQSQVDFSIPIRATLDYREWILPCFILETCRIQYNDVDKRRRVISYHTVKANYSTLTVVSSRCRRTRRTRATWFEIVQDALERFGSVTSGSKAEYYEMKKSRLLSENRI